MYYKATDVDGKDFRTGTLDYAGALTAGSVVEHPNMDLPMVPNFARSYLSTSVEPAETLIGGSWPCRLFVVEPIGEVLEGLTASKYKRACKSLRVVEELPAHQALGPTGEPVTALIERAKTLTYDEVRRLYAAVAAGANANAIAVVWAVVWDAAPAAARDAARDAARNAASAAARNAARNASASASASAVVWAVVWAASALIVRDKIPTEHYRILTAYWSSVIGKVHPDDESV